MLEHVGKYTAAAAITLLLAGCADEPDKNISGGGNYSECADAPQNNPVLVCDSLLHGVEDLCGFGLTVDPCACYSEVSPCAVSSEGISDIVMAFLEGIMDCEKNSADCTEYLTCLGVLGEVDNCANPTEWTCITTIGASEESEE